VLTKPLCTGLPWKSIGRWLPSDAWADSPFVAPDRSETGLRCRHAQFPSSPADLRRPTDQMKASLSAVTNVNVDDLERCMGISPDIAPAFEDQARQWLDPNSGKSFDAGVRERLIRLLEGRARARAFVDRWGSGFADVNRRAVDELV